MREATTQRIKEVLPIKNADNIELVKVLGWECVVKKGEFQAGDLCIYFEIDSLLPISPEFEFLRKGCHKTLPDGTQGFVLKTIKLRKQISQGLCMPLDILKEDFENDPLTTGLWEEFKKEALVEGVDVSGVLDVTHYEKPVPACLAGSTKGRFPSFLRKTDETRVQSEPEMLEKIQGKPYYITTKLDGTSATYYKKDGELGACSRNLEKKYFSENQYWRMAEKYKLAECLPEGYCIQGEIVGPGIQKNSLMLKEIDLYIFNMYKIEGLEKTGFHELNGFCFLNKIKMVPLEEIDLSFNYTQEDLLKKAQGLYKNSDKKKEGIVVRSNDCQISFKVLNNSYLLGEES